MAHPSQRLQLFRHHNQRGGGAFRQSDADGRGPDGQAIQPQLDPGRVHLLVLPALPPVAAVVADGLGVMVMGHVHDQSVGHREALGAAHNARGMFEVGVIFRTLVPRQTPGRRGCCICGVGLGAKTTEVKQ